MLGQCQLPQPNRYKDNNILLPTSTFNSLYDTMKKFFAGLGMLLVITIVANILHLDLGGIALSILLYDLLDRHG